MDKEQEEMQFLGYFGIHCESCKIILSWRKIFTQITLALILPLAFIFLLHIEVSDVMFAKIIHSEMALDETPTETPRYQKISNMLSKEWALFWLLETAYFTFLLIFSLLSTSAVVYTIASIYTGREVSFSKVLSVVPKVWRRLMVTFLCIFVAFFLYNIVAIAILVSVLLVLAISNINISMVVVFVILVLYLVGLVYMSIVWQLASVVSVLEEVYGIQAMIKSRALIKGKMGLAIVVFFKLNVLLGAIQIAFKSLVVSGDSLGIFFRIGFGMLFFSLLCVLILFGLTIQTVIYFVCKSYHHENIDKSALSDHLEVYLGEYVPLKSKDVQLEQYV